VCTMCNIRKDHKDFYKRSDTNKYRSHCKECTSINRSSKWFTDPEFKERQRVRSKTHSINKRYGLTLDEFDSYIDDNHCEICNSTIRLVLDHCHVTGDIRGVLCNKCNVGIGMLGDDLAGLETAAFYLRGESCQIS